MVDKVGTREQARDLLQVARQLELEAHERKWADELQARWLYEECKSRIDAAVKDGRYADALTELDTLIEQTTDGVRRWDYRRWRSNLEWEGKLAEANEAVREGHIDEARSGYRAITQGTGVPPQIERTARSRLQELPTEQANEAER